MQLHFSRALLCLVLLASGEVAHAQLLGILGLSASPSPTAKKVKAKATPPPAPTPSPPPTPTPPAPPGATASTSTALQSTVTVTATPTSSSSSSVTSTSATSTSTSSSSSSLATSTVSNAPNSSPTSTPQASKGNSDATTIGVAVGVTVGVVAFLAGAVLGLLYKRRRDRREALEGGQASNHADDPSYKPWTARGAFAPVDTPLAGISKKSDPHQSWGSSTTYNQEPQELDPEAHPQHQIRNSAMLAFSAIKRKYRPYRAPPVELPGDPVGGEGNMHAE